MFTSYAIFLTATSTLLVLLTSQLVLLPGGVDGSLDHDEYGHFINEYVMEIDGDGLVAELVAESHNMKLIKHLDTLGNIYHYLHEDTPQRAKRSAENFLDRLRNDPNVVFAEQEQILQREKRPAINRNKRVMVYDKQTELDSPLSNSEAILDYYFGKGNKRQNRACTQSENVKIGLMKWDDPHFCLQWYLRNNGKVEGHVGNDVGVVDVWKKYNIFGKGVTVTVLDDGVDHKHPDLQRNYDRNASLDLNDPTDKENDPMPAGKGSTNAHGTRCAGEIASEANNGVCGVGVAFECNIGGVRMLDGRVTDSIEARALSHNRDYVDIYSASWGPRDDGMSMEKPSKLTKKALKDGAEKGRNGRGNIFSWATGNGGKLDDCNADGYVQDIHTISVGCINNIGWSTYYSEICASTMCVIYTGGSHDPPGSPGYDHPKLSIITTDIGGECNLDFEGTSSAAPLAAGVFALVLEACPNCTWRDMQNLIAETAIIPNGDEDGWTLNGGGYHLNSKFGFGALNAAKMVGRVVNNSWTPVGEQHVCSVSQNNDPIAIQKGQTITQTLTTDGCQADSATAIERLEHTEVHMTIQTKCRGCLSIKLTSPLGTVSELLSWRPNDKFDDVFDWTFMTVHNWGENPSGSWMISIEDNGDYKGEEAGSLEAWSMTIYGVVGENPNKVQTSRDISSGKKDQKKAYKADSNEIQAIMSSEKAEIKEQSVKQNDEVTTEEEKEAELQDLNNLAKLVLDEKDYNVINDYLFKNKNKKAKKEEYSNDLWKKRFLDDDDDHTQKVKGNVDINNDKKENNDIYSRKVNANEDDSITANNNQYSSNYKTYKREKVEKDIDETIDLIKEILSKLQDKK